MHPNRLRELREARGLTLRQLGQATGIAYSHLSKIETGDGRPSDSRKIVLAAYFGVSVGDLFFAETVENDSTACEAVA